jgi:hypothetical protein
MDDPMRDTRPLKYRDASRLVCRNAIGRVNSDGNTSRRRRVTGEML